MVSELNKNIPPCIELAPSCSISARDYSILRTSGTTHILCDVRSKTQFDIIRLESFHTNQYLVNFPLKSLEKSSSDEIYAKLVKDIKINFHENVIELFVMCRRGIDSITGTGILMRQLEANYPSVKVKNITGGLSAWHHEVDNNFPLY
jgi:rhodanese-related sulfurtransferase